MSLCQIKQPVGNSRRNRLQEVEPPAEAPVGEGPPWEFRFPLESDEEVPEGCILAYVSRPPDGPPLPEGILDTGCFPWCLKQLLDGGVTMLSRLAVLAVLKSVGIALRGRTDWGACGVFELDGDEEAIRCVDRWLSVEALSLRTCCWTHSRTL